MRRALVSLIAVTFLLAACTTSEDDDAATGGSPTTTETPEDGATTTEPEAIDDPRAPGVTEDEILIGITYPDLAPLKSIIGFDHGDYEAAYRALFDRINAAGGIGGRQLSPVFAPVDPSATDAAAAACTKLTQDQPVFVTLGFFLDDEVLCFIETNGAAVIGGTMTDELLARAAAPWFTAEPSEDLATEVVEALAESGALDGTVGIVGLPPDQASYERRIRPVLGEHGVEPVSVAYIDSSSPDVNAVNAATDTIAQRFQADGVDTVLLVGGGAGGFFPGALVRTGYDPELAFIDLNSALTWAGGEGNDLSVLDGAVTGGPFDPSNQFLEMDGATADCVEVMTQAGLELVHLEDVPDGGSQQYSSALLACRNVAVLAAILESVGDGELNYGTFQTAANSLGEVDVAGYPEPMTFGPPPSADGDPVVYLHVWDSAAREFVIQDD